MARKSRKNTEVTVVEHSPATPTYKAAAYVRLSCDDRKKRGDSLETQRNIIENYAAVTPGINIVGVYSDNNRSGMNFERPGFQSMMQDIERGVINCIIVKDLTRFGRNAIDCGYYLEKHLPPLGVRFIAITDSYDSNEPDSGFLLPIKNIIAESYALDIGRKVKAVHRQNITDGRYVGRLAPYGYIKSPDDCHKLIIDEETGPVVRQIFDWAHEGESLCEISRRLNALNVPNPGQRNFQMGFNKTESRSGLKQYWQPSTIRGMLSERVYVGDMVQGKTQVIAGKRTRVDPADWICVTDTHEPIISRDVFQLVQGQRELASGQSESKMYITESIANPLRGKVYCAHCHRPMSRSGQNNNKTPWFRCQSQSKYGKCSCTTVSIKESEIVAHVIEKLQKDYKNANCKYRAFESIAAENRSGNSKVEADLKEINRELGNAGRFIKSLYENMVSGVINHDEFRELKRGYESRIETLSSQADKIRAEIRNAENDVSALGGFLGAAAATIKNACLTEEVANMLIERVNVNSDKTFDVVFHHREMLEAR